jgi:hypothetical protein
MQSNFNIPTEQTYEATLNICKFQTFGPWYCVVFTVKESMHKAEKMNSTFLDADL